MPGGRPAKSISRSEFGERLFQARTERGLTQVEIAKALGITQPSYADWERRSVALKPEYLPRLAEILCVSVEFLLGMPERPKRTASGPTGKLRRLFDEVGELPRSQQQRIMAMIEDMIVAHRAKESSDRLL